jgi:hypothetical protein
VVVVTALIEVETEDFARASRSIFSDAADPMFAAISRLITTLQDSGGMAGSDPAGRDWASAYDRATTATLGASQDVINGCYKLSAMFAQTARNYEAADAASTAGVRRAIAAAAATAPTESRIWLNPQLPGAAGGSGGEPSHWGLIADVVGYVWPNGHQDRLRTAAAAWRASGDGLWKLSANISVAAAQASSDRLPEYADMSTVCDSLYTHIGAVSMVQFSLADACDQLADHLDEVHSAVEHELVSLIEWTAGIEAGGALLSLCTFGAAEAPTQAVEAGRIAKTAAKVGELIQKFVALARTAAQAVAGIVDRADRVAAELVGLLDVRLSAAVVATVKVLPGVVRVRELAAISRLSDGARGLPTLSAPLTRLESKYKHAQDFGIIAAKGRGAYDAFLKGLDSFIGESGTVRVSATRGRYHQEPAIISYSPKSALVVVQHPDGSLWTCFRMSRTQLTKVRKYGSLGGTK